jgi:DNA-binding PadR family transcriptional regulator
MSTKSRKSGAPLSQQEFFILASLSEAPKHGYAIARQVKELSEGKVDFSAATLYQNLKKLEEAGLIALVGDREVSPGKVRKVYKANASGVLALEAQMRLFRRAASIVPQHVTAEA